MTLYREIPGNYLAEWIGDNVVQDLVNEYGVLEIVEPVEMLIECPGRINGDVVANCDKCGGEGFIVARVVVVEDSV